jgi:FdhD protein
MKINPQQISAGILAAGTNIRNGGEPKAMIPVKGKPIVEWQLEVLHARFTHVMLNVRNEKWHEKYAEKKVYDELPDIGPLGGIHALLKDCPTPWLFVVPCDMPNLNTIAIDKLIRAIDGKCQLVLYSLGRYRQPFPLLIKKEILHDLEVLIQKRHLRRMFDFLYWFKKKTVILADVPSLTSWFKQYSRQPEVGSEPMPSSRRVPIKRYNRERLEALDDIVVTETEVTIWLDKALWFRTVALDDCLPELAIGRLYLEENLIVSQGQVVVNEPEDCKVELHVSVEGENLFKPLMSDEPVIDYLRIPGLMTAFSGMSKLFKTTGGVHSSALVKNGKIFRHFEDVSRHHAIDKAVGHMLLHREPATTILLSCRITKEIIEKLFRAGIRQVVSLSAPTYQAIQFAGDKDLELIGFARNGRFNCYTSL